MFDIIKENNSQKTIAFAVFLVLTVLWMGVIFGFSANNAEDSTIQSNAVTEFVIRIFNSDFDLLPETEQESLIEQYDGIIRKIAHFASYALLAYLMYHTLVLASFFHYINIYVPAAISVVLCAVFAATDEYHQTFVDGRAGRFTDVLIDTSGALCGVLLAIVVLSTVTAIVNKRK